MLGKKQMERLKNNFSLEVLGFEQPSLESVIAELSERQSNFKQFLVEAGVSTTSDYYSHIGRKDVTKNPIDTLVLTVMIDGHVRIF